MKSQLLDGADWRDRTYRSVNAAVSMGRSGCALEGDSLAA